MLEKGATSRNGDGMKDRYNATAELCENLCRVSAPAVVNATAELCENLCRVSAPAVVST